jgi:hypothetical protein
MVSVKWLCVVTCPPCNETTLAFIGNHRGTRKAAYRAARPTTNIANFPPS